MATKKQAEKRWEDFQASKEFKQFLAGKSDEALTVEFEGIVRTRSSVWAVPGYERAKHLIAEDLTRAPDCVAFQFNHTVPYYNASTIYLGDRHYIASEGPRSKDVLRFFHLLTSQGVTHLVRLTGSHEGWMEKCHAYWDGLVEEVDGNTYLKIPMDGKAHSVRAFHMDHWLDRQGVNPQELLSMALRVRGELEKTEGRLLVHCSGGVGRTGTFLAALAIVDAIDKGESFSIEEIVYRLSLQRVRTVSSLGQYITLHRLAEIYPC